MATGRRNISRRGFLKGAAAGVATFSIVPSHVLGGAGRTSPSDTFGGTLIGCGGRGGGTFGSLKGFGLNIKPLAACDVNDQRSASMAARLAKGQTVECKTYRDFRRVLERKDIDIVAIATPPHWHALISIAAMECGKDVLCEKPMTRFVSEGRAVADTAKRYGRIFQIGTYGRFGMSGSDANRQVRKLMTSGLLKKTDAAYVHRGGLKVKQWSGKLNVPVQPVPEWLDWEMYCGPSPLKPFQAPRIGGTHRWYWDYDGGGFGDMGQHKFDGPGWLFGLDTMFPVRAEACAPPAHPEVSGMWAWSKLTYPNGFTMVVESGEWGEPSGLKSKPAKVEDLGEDDRKKLAALPDPAPLVRFGDAVKTRQQAGGHAEASHRVACIMHLSNVAIRLGRAVDLDPATERAIGDDEANRLIDQPMRAPWHL